MRRRSRRRSALRVRPILAAIACIAVACSVAQQGLVLRHMFYYSDDESERQLNHRDQALQVHWKEEFSPIEASGEVLSEEQAEAQAQADMYISETTASETAGATNVESEAQADTPVSEAVASDTANVTDVESTVSCPRLVDGGIVLLVWAYDDPPQEHRLEMSIRSLPTNVDVRVFCGSSECIRRVQNALALHIQPSSCIHLTRLTVQLLAHDTPMQDWTDHHVQAKLLSAHNYEEHLQVAMQLAALYKYGGKLLHLLHTNVLEELQYYPRRYFFTPTPSHDKSLELIDHGGSVMSPRGGLWGAAAPERSSEIHQLMNRILAAYSWDKDLASRYSKEVWPVRYNFDTFCTEDTNCRKVTTKEIVGPLATSTALPPNRIYATLGFEADMRNPFVLYQQEKTKGDQGDEINGLAGMQFLPRLDAFIERDRLDIVRLTTSGRDMNRTVTLRTPSSVMNPHQKVHVFLNGWWGTGNLVWPPPSYIEPVTVGMHFDPSVHDKIRTRESRAFLKKNAPAGASDPKTLQLLRANKTSIDSIFTACLTMSLTFPPLEDRNGGVLIVNVDESDRLEQIVPPEVLASATYLTQDLVRSQMSNDRVLNLNLAYSELMQYRQAKVVVTGAVHVALSSVAMGTAVIFIDNDNARSSGRLEGLERLMYVVPMGQNGFIGGFDWENPPKNPSRGTIKRYSNTIKHLAACHTGISDSARKFGLVPDTWKADEGLVVCGDGSPTFSNRTIHIATVVDANFLHIVFPSWINALARSNGHEELVVYMLTYALSSKQLCLLRHIVANVLPNATVYTVPVDFLEARAKNYVGLTHVSIATQARLYLPSLLPCVSKVIWIDLDAFAVGLLRTLWSVPLPACGICGRTSHKPFLNRNKYLKQSQWTEKFGNGFNAGVMLISLDSLRKHEFEETLVSHWGEELGQNDQLVYNLACNGTHGALEYRMNVFQKYPEFTPPREEWILVHFQSSNKPWKGKKLDKDFQRVWDMNRLTFEDAIAVA
jgi:lipopolysaccharide biosynthesis glycosyltransferase